MVAQRTPGISARGLSARGAGAAPPRPVSPLRRTGVPALPVLPVLFALLPVLGPRPAAAEPPAPAAAAEAAAPGKALSDADLDRLVGELGASEAPRRRAAAEAIASADADGTALYVERLNRPVTGAAEIIQRLIFAIWGQYPNPDYPRAPGKDPPMWFSRPEPPVPPGTPRSKRPPPHNPETVDWLVALAELDLADPFLQPLAPADLRAVRTELLLRVALLRAIASAGKQGNRDAVYQVFQFAFVRDGLFRDEVGRTLRGMGSYAVPGLIRIYNNRTRANAKMRRYASYQLDRMDRLRPSKAIATAPDDVVRADIIHAYGEVQALDAVEAVLEQVDASSHRVRREARWAWRRYVDGPEPPAAPKRKRKLPGGKEENEEKEDYLNYREMAVLALGRTFQTIWNQDPDPKLSASQLTDQLFAHYDKHREEQYEQLFASATSHAAAGDLEKAVSEFAWILANQPDHPRRADMADAFRRYGEQLAQSGSPDGLSRGLGLMRQALALAPGQPGADKLRGQIHLLDGKQAQSRGGDGRTDFALAVQADPGLTEARQALLSVTPRPSYKRQGLWVLLVSALTVALLSLLLWRRLRPAT